MGQHSVIFHALLACLVPTADAVGVAPSGLSSSDFYRSRRFRTTNSTPSVASIHDSQESAVAILDDLSRKSRVFLAQDRSDKKIEHSLLTWNAGGGAPQPEFLGGPWEIDHGGMYSKVEQMTAVLLFELAGCGTVPKDSKEKGGVKVDFDDKDFKKYRPRYSKMYEAFYEFKKKKNIHYDKVKAQLDGLTTEKLLGSLKKTVDPTVTDAGALPSWTTHGGKQCTVPAAIADALELCPSKAKKDADKAKKAEKNAAKIGNREPDPEKGRQPCDNFNLKSEGCWKKRGALPVYGKSFFELYAARKGGPKDKKKDGAEADDEQEYWTLFMAGLAKQSKKPGKGCSPDPADKFPKEGQPGKHIRLEKGATATYDITKGSTTEPATIPTPAIFTFEEWSKTAFWDTLLIELTALSVEAYNALEYSKKDDLELTEGEGDKPVYKAVQYIDDKAASAKIAEIVQGATKFLKPDVIFFQELDIPDEEGDEGYAIRKAAEDTAIYVNMGFGGGIDEKASAALQKLWDAMMGRISDTIEKEYVKVMAQALGAVKLAELYKSKDPADKITLSDAHKAAGSTIPYNGIPVQQLPTEDDGPQEAPNDKEKSMAERIDFQRNKFAEAAAEKGVVYATKLNLVTVAVTAAEPKVLLFSIHADSDGYYCAQYLNLAKVFYDAVSAGSKITHMYIGMDANVQPPYGHPSWENKKGFTFTQLEKALPDGMKMVDPKQMTVKKVRTFLQTQFAKIGKDDDQKKDLLFVYPYADAKPEVFNTFDADAEDNKFSFVGPPPVKDPPEKDAAALKEGEDEDGPSVYYPKNEWPVDHFMSYAHVNANTVNVKDTMFKALHRSFRKLFMHLPYFPGKQLGDAALKELRKPPEKPDETKVKK